MLRLAIYGEASPPPMTAIFIELIAYTLHSPALFAHEEIISSGESIGREVGPELSQSDVLGYDRGSFVRSWVKK